MCAWTSPANATPCCTWHDDFTYAIRCWNCGRVWVLSPEILLTLVPDFDGVVKDTYPDEMGKPGDGKFRPTVAGRGTPPLVARPRKALAHSKRGPCALLSVHQGESWWSEEHRGLLWTRRGEG